MRRAVLTAATTAAVATPAWAQAGGGSGADVLRELVTTVLAVVAVCVIAFVCLLALKRLQAGDAAQPGVGAELRFVRALPVGTRERLVVVRWRGRTLLLGVTAGGIAVLDAGGAGDEASDPPLPPAELTRTLLARVFARRPRENPS